MIDRLLTSVLKRRFVVVAFFALVAVFGAFSLVRMLT